MSATVHQLGGEFRSGDLLRVVDIDGLSKDLAKILPLGSHVTCSRVSPSGSVVISGHGGLFKPHRFIRA